jgi:hypothetical protein
VLSESGQAGAAEDNDATHGEIRGFIPMLQLDPAIANNRHHPFGLPADRHGQAAAASVGLSSASGPSHTAPKQGVGSAGGVAELLSGIAYGA